MREFFNQEIEPAALCENCEYFDAGGLTPEGKPMRQRGDCENINSPATIVSTWNSCGQFFPCRKRWPDADHG